ncbi:MAG: hypothetical protein KJ558_11170 [Gammaproteobacteria bacterium]|nr:hypothetical protein [Gammaproteobacteria bacterium]MBU1655367.1 hypothetical protein [Gammaproteobacteria bacterium]MBU1960213.1 hypothetical protein [Gammaproteobacteria bacterium]
MCFSANVSFAIGTLLLPMGLYSANQARARDLRYLPLASFPLLFGLQQLIEGVLWVGLSGDLPQLQTFGALGFLFFAFFFWPIMVPFAAWCLEPLGTRRRWMVIAILLGCLLGGLLYLPLLLDETRIIPTITYHSISYHSFLITDGIVSREANSLLYSILVSFPLLFSSRPPARGYGLLVLISVVLSALYFQYAFTSVWCFFAALLSVYSLRIVRGLPG